ncbi:MAG: 4Fe-4S binding protein, partial [Spirochaetales bacterium]|nr:4Fe-4S binding protein [Spirochaetales bacterium]
MIIEKQKPVLNLSGRVIKKLKHKWLGLLILIILFSIFNYNEKTLFFSNKGDSEITISLEYLGNLFPEGVLTIESEELPGWNQVENESGQTLGYYVVSENNRWKYSGYAGDVPLLIMLNKDQRISGIILLESRETRRFLLKLYNLKFMKIWNGLTLKESAELEVDTVSGVTLTSQAIIANLSEVLEKSTGKSILGKINYRRLIIRTAEIVLFLFALASFFIEDLRKYRLSLLLFLTFLYGFIAGDFVSLGIIQGFLTGAVSFYGNPILWTVLVFSIILPIIFNKNLYCNYICPFGAAQEILGKLSSDKKKLPQKIRKIFKYSRP